MEFKDKLKLLRQVEGLTQKDVAEMCGKKDRAIQKYEYGTHTPSYEFMQKLCDAFPEYTLWLMTGKTEPNNNQIDPIQALNDKENATHRVGFLATEVE